MFLYLVSTFLYFLKWAFYQSYTFHTFEQSKIIWTINFVCPFVNFEVCFLTELCIFVLKFSQYFLSPCTNTAIGAGGIQNNTVINCKHKSMIENQEKYKSPIIVGGKCIWSYSSEIPFMGLRVFL